MNIEKKDPVNLWNVVPFDCQETPKITPYLPKEKSSSWAVVIYPGGGYSIRAPHEGEGYAEFLASNGICAFVVDYRVAPHRFPCQLADARRAVQWVRHHAEAYGIRKDKVAVMGSSAGGHLAALVSTYEEALELSNTDEIDREAWRPNAQILCYPVISLEADFGHVWSGKNLLGEAQTERIPQVSPLRLVTEQTPPAFLWHTFADGGVNVINSLAYATALRNCHVKAEMHLFPDGGHGLGLCMTDQELYDHHWPDLVRSVGGCPDKILDHNRCWGDLLVRWLRYSEE